MTFEGFEYEDCSSDLWEHYINIFSDKNIVDIYETETDSSVHEMVEISHINVDDTKTGDELMENVSYIMRESPELSVFLPAVGLLGELGYSDLLMYWFIVSEAREIEKRAESRNIKIMAPSPEQFFDSSERNTEDKPLIDVTLRVAEGDFRTVRRILAYLKQRNYFIVSDSYQLDGRDLIVNIMLKSAAGYFIKVTVVVYFESESAAGDFFDGLDDCSTL